jgi:hypothetical protein
MCNRGHRDRMVVGFTYSYAISTYCYLYVTEILLKVVVNSTTLDLTLLPRNNSLMIPQW